FAAYGVVAAPASLTGGRSLIRAPDHLVGMVHITAPGPRRGVLMLSTSNATLSKMKGSPSDPLSLQDWMRELTNQLAGRIRNRFARYQVPLQLGLPTALNGSVMEKDPDSKGLGLVCVFHTTRDKIHVILTG